MEEYKLGYRLEAGIYSWNLSEREEEIFQIGHFLVDNRVSIRQCARNFDISKSCIHRRIHKELKDISFELYKCVCRQLQLNKSKYFK